MYLSILLNFWESCFSTEIIFSLSNLQLELMKAVSFMYVKPPGYNAESAKAAETADEKKMQEQDTDTQGPQDPSASTSTSK